MHTRSGQMRCNREAFTLIELVLVLALIGLAATLVVINANVLFETAGDLADAEVLAIAVKEARYQAAVEKKTVSLRYNPASACFEIEDHFGRSLALVATDYQPDPQSSPLAVQFFAILPEKGLPARTAARPEERLNLIEVSRVHFSPARVSTPFAVELRYGNVSEILHFDPFSNLQLQHSP